MNIDHELRDALRRKEAPANLADRVLQRIQETAERRPAPSPSQSDQRFGAQGGMTRWLAAAAVLAVAAGGAGRYYTQQREAEATRVQQEVRIALQITNDTLARLQTKLSPPADDSR
jgi:uncharacterized protein HemX